MYTLKDSTKVIIIPDNYTGMLTTEYGSKAWYQYGKLHRVDGPAVEWFNGTKYWYQDDKLHQVDGPAIEESDGTKKWYQYGKLHRVDDPAIEWANGDTEWYQYGKRHRLDGPAYENKENGIKEVWINDIEIIKQTRIVCIR